MIIMIFGSHFIFDGTDSRMFDLFLCSFEGAQNESLSMGLGMEGITTELRDRTIDYGGKWTEKIAFEFSVAHGEGREGEPFSKQDIREITSWLTASKDLKWLAIYDDEEMEYWYYCRFTNIETRRLNGTVIGFNLEVECDSQFAYSELKTINFSFTTDDRTTEEGTPYTLDAVFSHSVNKQNLYPYRNNKNLSIDTTMQSNRHIGYIKLRGADLRTSLYLPDSSNPQRYTADQLIGVRIQIHDDENELYRLEGYREYNADERENSSYNQKNLISFLYRESNGTVDTSKNTGFYYFDASEQAAGRIYNLCLYYYIPNQNFIPNGLTTGQQVYDSFLKKKFQNIIITPIFRTGNINKTFTIHSDVDDTYPNIYIRSHSNNSSQCCNIYIKNNAVSHSSLQFQYVPDDTPIYIDTSNMLICKGSPDTGLSLIDESYIDHIEDFIRFKKGLNSITINAAAYDSNIPTQVDVTFEYREKYKAGVF